MSEEEPATTSTEQSPPPQEGPTPVPLPDYSQPPQIGSDGYGSQPPGAMDRIIPTRNPKALMAYYFGVFSIVPCFTPILAPAAIVLGILGLKECKKTPDLPGKGHAVTGIVIGSITGAIVYGIIIVAIVASLSK